MAGPVARPWLPCALRDSTAGICRSRRRSASSAASRPQSTRAPASSGCASSPARTQPITRTANDWWRRSSWSSCRGSRWSRRPGGTGHFPVRARPARLPRGADRAPRVRAASHSARRARVRRPGHRSPPPLRPRLSHRLLPRPADHRLRQEPARGRARGGGSGARQLVLAARREGAAGGGAAHTGRRAARLRLARVRDRPPRRTRAGAPHVRRLPPPRADPTSQPARQRAPPGRAYSSSTRSRI